jgi:predicted phosphodiesterase
MVNNDSIFTIYRYVIKSIKLNEPICLIPFGDIHRFSNLCSTERWFEFLEWAKKKKNTYFLGMGDYDDLMSFNERKAFNQSCFHDATEKTIDDILKERTEKLAKELSFMRGKLIGLVEGNHYGELENGITTTQKLCELLKCRYLGVSSFIRLTFEHFAKTCSLDIWAHHGKGASRLIGGSMNNIQQMENIADADICLSGHDHKKFVAMKTRLKLVQGGGNLELNHRKILFCRTGSFLKGYEPNEKSYVAKAMMSPTDMGVVKIELTPKRKCKQDVKVRHDAFYIDIHASV